jgi:predicted PurR-regulated permease PerM
MQGAMHTESSRDLVRGTLQLLALGTLIATTFWILRPFLVASAWAIMIVVATWPLLLQAQSWMGGRRGLAVLVMTMALLLILVVPLYLGIEAIVANVKQVASWTQSLTTLTVPPPPAWVDSIPLVGAKLTARWQQLAAVPPEELAARIAVCPEGGPVVRQSGRERRVAPRRVPAHGDHRGNLLCER